MFGKESRQIVKRLGSGKHLIPNTDLNHKKELMGVVVIRIGRFWPYPNYETRIWTLPELLGEKYDPETKVETVVNNFMTNMKISESAGLGGGHDLVAAGEIKGGFDSVDGQANSVSLERKEVDVKPIINKFNGRTLEKSTLEDLGLKPKDKLAFVNQIVYNPGPVTLMHNSKSEGCFSAAYQKMANVFTKHNSENTTEFEVPAGSTFAFGLVEIKLKDGKIQIDSKSWTHKESFVEKFKHDGSSNPLDQAKDEIESKEMLLEPLTELPESIRSDLLKKLQKVVEDRGALTRLEKTLEDCSEGSYDRPASPDVASFMDTLDVSGVSSSTKDAVYLLVSAMNTLPDVLPQLLMSCSLETLKVLNQLVDGLKDDGKAQLPEPLPAALKEDGEQRWAANLLCSTNETLPELCNIWDMPPEVLLGVLGLSVLGLNLMQPRK